MDPQTIFTTLLSVLPVQYLIYVAAFLGVCAAVMPWLPVPASTASAYGRLYALLNLAAQNFRNVANRTAPASTATTKSTIAPLGLALLFAAGLGCSACTTTGSTTTIDTAELAADAGAIDFAAQAIESIPTLSSHLSADQVAQVNDALAQIKTITAQINASTSGSIDINTGKGWASSLATEFQTVLTIAGTVASALDPSVAGYITTAEQIIPLIEAAVGLTPASVSVSAGGAPAVRATLYRGV